MPRPPMSAGPDGDPEVRRRGGPIRDDRLAQLFGELADAVVIADPDGVIVLWNEAATKLFGWPASEAVGSSLDLIIPERLRNRHWSGYRRVMETGHTDYGTRLLEVPAMHQDGRGMSVAFTVTLLRRPGESRPEWIAAVLRDETERWQERRRMKKRLAELEALDRTMSTAEPDRRSTP